MPFSPKKLREARTKAGISQGRLAHEISVRGGSLLSKESIYRWERGDNPPDANALELIAAVTEKPIDFFYSAS